MILAYRPEMDIRNTDSIPCGGGCRYLEVLKGLDPGVYIAKAWKRKIPEGSRSEKCGRIYLDFEAKGENR